MPRRFSARFASLLAMLVIAAVLTDCAPERSVPAPLAPPQSSFFPPPAFAPPPAPPAPPAVPKAAKVALLVPLSGPNAALGKALLDAAQLALFETGDPHGMTLIPRDTGGTPEGAAKAARSVIADGAQLILGPLLAAEVAAVKPVARDAHVNIIAFSTVTSLAGGGTFLMGFLPRQEVVREVGYARTQGLDRFAALVPDSPYGHLMAEALRDAVAGSGAAVTKVAFYGPTAAASAAAIKSLGGNAPAAAIQFPASAAPAPAFGALLVPEGGARLGQVAGQLQAAGLDRPQVRLLGSGLWDVPAIGNDPTLVGGWFAASPPGLRRAFQARFEAAYGHAPPRLASLGFDAAALAAALARQGGAHPFSRDAIMNPSGFTGVDGLFRFRAGGLVERGLAVLEVEPGGNTVASPAPQSFQNLGY